MFKCISSVDVVTRLRTGWPEHHNSILGSSKVIYLPQNFQNSTGTRLSIGYQWFPFGYSGWPMQLISALSSTRVKAVGGATTTPLYILIKRRNNFVCYSWNIHFRPQISPKIEPKSSGWMWFLCKKESMHSSLSEICFIYSKYSPSCYYSLEGMNSDKKEENLQCWCCFVELYIPQLLPRQNIKITLTESSPLFSWNAL
jgi:hypothetical protein